MDLGVLRSATIFGNDNQIHQASEPFYIVKPDLYNHYVY